MFKGIIWIFICIISRSYFAKAAQNLVYVPEPLCVLSLYCEYSVNALLFPSKKFISK